ncbi:MAG: ferritin [Planctomycetes bacterium]|nr:ferritin [Planctomycetota bacterium]MBU4400151.1 ferritin [Planctomycetota bacterium]MCG2684913.1 ferritin [Planctomycetales bacterium]
MLSSKVQEALNRQVNAELYSSYLYLSMAAHLEAENMRGMAQWMRVQSGEETTHGMKIYDYIIERGGSVTLTRIDAPKTNWASPVELFEDAYAHEQKVTAMINGLMDLVIAEKDHAGHDFLEWFVAEQVEEESAALAIVEQLKLVGDSGVGLYMIDRQLGQRSPSAPAAE